MEKPQNRGPQSQAAQRLQKDDADGGHRIPRVLNIGLMSGRNWKR